MRKTITIIFVLMLAALFALPAAAEGEPVAPDAKALKITFTDPDTGETIGNIMFTDLPSEEPARGQAFERLQISLSLLRYPFDTLPPVNPGRPGDVISPTRDCGTQVCEEVCDEDENGNKFNCRLNCSSQTCKGKNDSCVCVKGIGIGGIGGGKNFR
jgi:hypothetical protein